MPSAICWWITNVGCHRKWRQAEEKSLGWLERVRREEFGCWPPRKPPTAVQQLPIWQITLSYTSYDLYPRADYVQRFGEPSGEDELQWNGESHVKKVATEWNVPCLGLQIVACWGHRLPGCSLFRKKVATNIQAATGNPTLLPSQAWRGEGILSTIAIEKLAANEHGDGLAAFLWSNSANSASSVTDALEDSSSLTLSCHAISLRRKFRSQTSDNMDRWKVQRWTEAERRGE